MFSSRVPRNLAPNRTSELLAELRRAGATLLDLTESNPTRTGFDYPTDLLRPLSDPRALRYDPSALGLMDARVAVSSEFGRRGLEVSPESIALTSSTSEAYALLFKLFCSPGDSVLVPRPSYPLFEHLTALEGVEVVPYPLEYHGRWRIDVGALDEAITERCRALLVVSPNNPTGSFLHTDDLVVLSELCAARGLALIGDEVFADYPLDPAPHAAAVLTQNVALTCSLGGLSKSAGLPQLKLAWIAFGGPANDVRQTLSAFEVVADNYLSVATPVQSAAADLIAHGAAIRLQIASRIHRNLQSLRAIASDYPQISVLPVEGGWSAVLQVPAYAGEEQLVVDCLTLDHAVVHPGYFFDFPREAFLVLSLLPDAGVFDEGVRRVLARSAAPRGVS
jgi:alanine-synthesizing transaminase